MESMDLFTWTGSYKVTPTSPPSPDPTAAPITSPTSPPSENPTMAPTSPPSPDPTKDSTSVPTSPLHPDPSLNPASRSTEPRSNERSNSASISPPSPNATMSPTSAPIRTQIRQHLQQLRPTQIQQSPAYSANPGDNKSAKSKSNDDSNAGPSASLSSKLSTLQLLVPFVNESASPSVPVRRRQHLGCLPSLETYIGHDAMSCDFKQFNTTRIVEWNMGV